MATKNSIQLKAFKIALIKRMKSDIKESKIIQKKRAKEGRYQDADLEYSNQENFEYIIGLVQDADEKEGIMRSNCKARN